MSRLEAVSSESCEESVSELFARMRLQLEVRDDPEFLTMLAHSPSTLQGLWGFIEATLIHGGGKVAPTAKELIALAAASSADATPLCRLMEKKLEERGFDKAVLSDLTEKGETLRLPERTRRILLFARKAALQPAILTDQDFEDLRKDGLEDSDLAELVGFSAMITALIAISRALGLTGDHGRGESKS